MSSMAYASRNSKSTTQISTSPGPIRRAKHKDARIEPYRNSGSAPSILVSDNANLGDEVIHRILMHSAKKTSAEECCYFDPLLMSRPSLQPFLRRIASKMDKRQTKSALKCVNGIESFEDCNGVTKTGSQALECKMMIIPVHIDILSHWILWIYFPATNLLTIVDSLRNADALYMMSSNETYHHTEQKMCRILDPVGMAQSVTAELQDKLMIFHRMIYLWQGNDATTIDDSKRVTYYRCITYKAPQTHAQCGYYVMLLAELIASVSKNVDASSSSQKQCVDFISNLTLKLKPESVEDYAVWIQEKVVTH